MLSIDALIPCTSPDHGVLVKVSILPDLHNQAFKRYVNNVYSFPWYISWQFVEGYSFAQPTCSLLAHQFFMRLE